MSKTDAGITKESISADIFQDLFDRPELFLEFINDFPGIVYRVNPADDGKVLFISGEVERITGYAPQCFTQYGLRLEDLIPVKQHQKILKAVDRSLQTNIPFRVNYHLTHKDGRNVNVSAFGRFRKNQAGDPIFCDGTILDVTNVSDSESVIAEQFSIIQRILDNSPNLIFVKDLEGRYKMVNKAMCDLFGLLPKDLLGLTDEVLSLPEGELQKFKRQDDQVFETGESVFADTQPLTLRNGEVGYFKTVKSPLFNQSGDLYGLLAIVTDVTEERKTENEITESRKMLDLIYNNVTDRIALLQPVDGQMRYVSVNQSYIKTFEHFGVGVKREELMGKVFIQHAVENNFFTGEVAAAALSRIENVMSTRQALEFTEVTPTPNGILYMDSSITPIYDSSGELLYIMYRSTDFTEIMRSNRALQEREMMLESINRNVNDGIYRSTVKHGLKYVNDAMYRIFGYEPGEFDQLKMVSLYVMPGERSEIVEELRRNGSFSNKEVLLRRKNNEHFWARLSCTMTRDHDGTEIIDGIVVDITERREMNILLESTNNHLKKTNSELDHLVYRTSHDLRSPIASLLGLAELMKLEGMDETQKEYLDLMEGQLHKLDKIILDIINYRKIAMSGPQNQQINLRAVVDDILSGVQFLSQCESIEKSIVIQNDIPFYNDGHNIQIIFNNLISNAIKYSRLDVATPKIIIELIVEPTVLKASIIDNGIGIEKEYVDQIFDMFFRATSHNTGTGLGLFIVKEAIEKLNGKISVSSKKGEGTQFTLEIPNLLKA